MGETFPRVELVFWFGDLSAELLFGMPCFSVGGLHGWCPDELVAVKVSVWTAIDDKVDYVAFGDLDCVEF